MKKRIKYFLVGVHGIEIVFVILVTIFGLVAYNRVTNNYLAKIGAGAFDALFNEEKYKKVMLYHDSYETAKHIEETSNGFRNMEQIIEENNYIKKNGLFFQEIYYALINKDTGQLITNDALLKEYIDAHTTSLKDVKGLVEKHINDKERIFIELDNNGVYNYYQIAENKTSEEAQKQYIQLYYRNKNSYNFMIKNDKITAEVLIATAILTVLLILKIIINFILRPQNCHFEMKVIRNFIYVWRDGFKYKHTRNKIITSLIGAAAIVIIYLYLVAGIRDQNVLLAFLGKYPFKGTLVIILIPVICIIYSLKKTLDISVINIGLKKLNEGDLEYNLDNIGENEIKELVDNINQIKEGYKIVVNEKLKNEKLKTELMSNVSHDLKTPLTSIINYVNILKNDSITEEERREYLCILEKKSLKLKLLIEDLFEISKLSSGKMTLNKNELDIVSLIHQGVGEYCTLYEEKNILFKVNSNKEEIFLELDGKLMSRLFENIIINALKYSLANTRVYVDIIDEENFVRILFKNISNYEMDFDTDEIFEKFVRADKSRTSSIEGSGMGLAITKSILELHNGNMKIEVDGDMFKLIIILPKCGYGVKSKISDK